MTTKKVFYAILAVGPLLMLLVGVVGFFGAMLSTLAIAGDDPEFATAMVFGYIGVDMLLLFLAGLGWVTGTVLYCRHILKNRRVPDDHRLLWLLAVVIVPGLGQILYFLTYVIHDQKGDNFPNLKPRQPWD